MKAKSRKFLKSRASPSRMSLLSRHQCKAIDQLITTGRLLDNSVDSRPPPKTLTSQLSKQKTAVSSALKTLDYGVFLAQLGLVIYHLVTGEIMKSLSALTSALSTLGKLLSNRYHAKR